MSIAVICVAAMWRTKVGDINVDVHSETWPDMLSQRVRECERTATIAGGQFITVFVSNASNCTEARELRVEHMVAAARAQNASDREWPGSVLVVMSSTGAVPDDARDGILEVVRG